MNNSFPDLGCLNPIDKKAKIVSEGVGESYDFREEKIVQTADSEMEIEFVTKPDLHHVKGREELRSIINKLVGVKFGSFTVLGLARYIAKKSKAKWVVRCNCGMYTLRTAKAIMNEKNNADCCERCRHIAYIRSR